MSYTQLIQPEPYIPAEEGMCLQYVRQTFGLPARYYSATEAWEKSASQHPDREYPEGVWHPVWWGVDGIEWGHVALRAPDGRVFSTSDLDPSPLHVHASVADVEAYYAAYDITLRYRGWTEDVAGFPVILIPDPEGMDMATPDELLYSKVPKYAFGHGAQPIGETTLAETVAWNEANFVKMRADMAAQSSMLAGMAGAIAAMAKGESFDQDKLLAGVQAAAQAGVAAAIASINTTVTVEQKGPVAG